MGYKRFKKNLLFPFASSNRVHGHGIGFRRYAKTSTYSVHRKEVVDNEFSEGQIKVALILGACGRPAQSARGGGLVEQPLAPLAGKRYPKAGPALNF
jgi:hypothetical protein